MMFVTTGGSLSAETTVDPKVTAERLVAHYQSQWRAETEKPFPPFDRSRYSPESTLRLFKDDMVKLQPYVETWYQARGKTIPEWPKHFFVPAEVWFSYCRKQNETEHLAEGFDVDNWVAVKSLFLAALCPWRYTQGIYRFTPSLGKALAASTLKGNIPCEVLMRLPQWSIYVETPSIRHEGKTLIGFWAFLQNADAGMEKAELGLLLNLVDVDLTQSLEPMLLPIASVSLEAVLRARYDTWLSRPESVIDGVRLSEKGLRAAYAEESVKAVMFERYIHLYQPILAMLLYLCTTEPDIVSHRQPGLKPANNYGKTLKQGFRLFPAEGPHIWHVGQTLEASLADHYRELPQEALSQAGEKREVRAHVRSAHWHGYWKGPRPKADQTDQREFIFHWIPPLFVRGARPAASAAAMTP